MHMYVCTPQVVSVGLGPQYFYCKYPNKTLRQKILQKYCQNIKLLGALFFWTLGEPNIVTIITGLTKQYTPTKNFPFVAPPCFAMELSVRPIFTPRQLTILYCYCTKFKYFLTLLDVF